MSIRSKILFGCMALTILTGALGLYAQAAERELAALALRIYDEAFMGMSYLRSAQVEFATLVNARHDGTRATATVEDVLSDLDVARKRAMSANGRAAAETLVGEIKLLHWQSGRLADADIAAVQGQFERAVETFAGDGFRYRRGVGEMVSAQARHASIVIGATVIIALSITLLLTRLIAPPIRRAVRIAQLIAGGKLDNAISLGGRGETGELLRALSTMQASIAAALAHIRRLMDDQATDHAGELAAQHAQLEAALENMNQGLCLFGPDGRLLIANQRFGDMFGMPPPNASAEEVMRSAGLDMLPSSAKSGEIMTLCCELPDGRTISVSQNGVVGGGWVATYEDISERRKTEERMAHMARHDPLTGLPNRVLFLDRLDAGLARVREAPPRCCASTWTASRP